jgi:hypothetical protein
MPLSSNRLITAHESSSPGTASERLLLARWHTRHRILTTFIHFLRSDTLRSGKTSCQRVVFDGMLPKDTFLGVKKTHSLERRKFEYIIYAF